MLRWKVDVIEERIGLAREESWDEIVQGLGSGVESVEAKTIEPVWNIVGSSGNCRSTSTAMVMIAALDRLLRGGAGDNFLLASWQLA